MTDVYEHMPGVRAEWSAIPDLRVYVTGFLAMSGQFPSHAFFQAVGMAKLADTVGVTPARLINAGERLVPSAPYNVDYIRYVATLAHKHHGVEKEVDLQLLNMVTVLNEIQVVLGLLTYLPATDYSTLLVAPHKPLDRYMMNVDPKRQPVSMRRLLRQYVKKNLNH